MKLLTAILFICGSWCLAHAQQPIIDRDTTINVTFDGYYGYNFNRPVGGINLLRAYDVQSNSFSLNQAAVVIERTPNLEAGRRWGMRLDLQYGQATETTQGNAANELRPQVYRPLWQAYGTYVFDVGKGLTVNFGKFASALGYETNYTKDNSITRDLISSTFFRSIKFADGFLGRVEYRRDFSNQPFFLTEQPGILKKEQNTATLGLVWWIGRKQGAW